MLPRQRKKPAADDTASERLALDLAALAGPDWRERRYGVAVSGGGDSMALLWLMAALLPQQVEAATVDHGLRTASRGEAELVAAYCAGIALPHAILKPAAPIKGSLQAAARLERYRLLEAWREERGLDHVLTAHHADDQLETMIMRLNRSSGVGGLAAIRSANGRVLRPLLEWRRSELHRIAREQDIPFVDDPSNRDARFDRARLREHLGDQAFLDPVAAARSARWLDEADIALDWAAEQAISSWPEPHDSHVLRDFGYPAEIFRRIVARHLKACAPALDLRGAVLDELIASMRAGRRAMIGDLLIDCDKTSETPAWRISAAPRRKVPKKD